MRNKLFASLAILTLALLVAACAAAPSTAPTSVPAADTAAPAAEPTAAEAAEPVAEPTTEPAVAGGALPDLGGRTIVAVTENAYTPLNFVDPQTGEAVGWEYDAVNEACRRLNCVVDWQVTAGTP
ncbi:MAG: hypothetical protein R2844_06800 [Caldilineales bacterium]